MTDGPKIHWESVDFCRDRSLDNLSQLAVEGCLTKKLNHEHRIAVTVAVANEQGDWRVGGWRDSEPFYPASVVKVFFAALAAEKLFKEGEITDAELERALRDMLRYSVNDATSLVVDWITNTTGGPNLYGEEYDRWRRQRETINRWLAKKGYSGISAIEKTWNEGPYGRERQLRGTSGKQTNSLCTNDAVRFFIEYFQASCFDDAPGRTNWYQKTFHQMKRNLSQSVSSSEAPDEQATMFSLSPIPTSWTVFSKAGWTDDVRHDLAFIQTPADKRFAWAIFTSGISDNFEVIPAISREILEGLPT